MERISVRAPDGMEWTVARRKLPWRPRLRHDPGGIDPVGLVLQLLSLPFLLLELLAAVLVRLALVALRRPWPVEAVTDGPPRQRLVWRGTSMPAARMPPPPKAPRLRLRTFHSPSTM